MTNEQINEMKKAMQTIGKICRQEVSLGDCRGCPFDGFCTSINESWWEHNWHDMYDTFCEGEENW